MKNFIFIFEKTLIYYFILKYNSLNLLLDLYLIKKLFLKFFIKNLLKIKFGIDVNKNKIHLGHFYIIKKIILIKIIIKIIIIIGIKTTLLGDPSYKRIYKFKNNKTNFLFIIKQLKQLFKNKINIVIYFNSDWINLIYINNFIKLIQNINILTILKRNDFKLKFEKNLRINISEILYILFQSYDSIFIKSDLELGGFDQKLNFIFTNYIKNKFNRIKQSSILFPLLLINNKKISKTSDCLSINDNIFLIKKKLYKEKYIEYIKYIFYDYKKNLNFFYNKEKFYIKFLKLNYYNLNFFKYKIIKNKIIFLNIIKINHLNIKLKYLKLNNLNFINLNNLLFKNNYNINYLLLIN